MHACQDVCPVLILLGHRARVRAVAVGARHKRHTGTARVPVKRGLDQRGVLGMGVLRIMEHGQSHPHEPITDHERDRLTRLR